MGNMTPKNIEKYQKHYSESRLLAKIGKSFRKAGLKVIYLVLLIYYVLTDRNTPAKHKVLIAGTLGYFILPFDIVPDLLPMLGYTDDIAAIVACLRIIYTNITPQVKKKATERLNTWFSDIDYKKVEEYDNTYSK